MRRIVWKKARNMSKKSAQIPKIKIKYIVLAFFAVLIYLLNLGIKPVVETVSGNQARILCTSLINKAVLNELENMPAEYESLVKVIYDSVGNVKALETNTVELNKLRVRLTESVNASLSTLPNQNVRIPLGTLTGIELLSGRGPDVKLKMQPSSYVESSMYNSFDSAGINQTHHMIMIEFTIEMSAIIAPYVTPVVVTSSVVIAETIIVGTVPNFFADLNLDNSKQ